MRRWVLPLGIFCVSWLALFGTAGAASVRSPQLPGGLRSVGSGAAAPGSGQASTSSAPDWLSAINYWRQAAGLAAVSDQPAWDLGIQHHLTYLEDTPASYMTGQYASAHTENPQSPYYTSDGATEGGDSDLEWVVHSDLEAIDGWLTAPFHAIGMLRAQLTQVAFAEDSAGYAGLDVLQGLDYNQPPATSPILYPGPGSTTTLPTASDYEAPDPLETCGWQGMQVGLPLIALLTQAPAATLTASVSGPSGPESTSNGDLCVVDTTTYRSSDPVYGPTGASILQNDKAVLLIPRAPLATGTYSVDIKQPSQPDITWSFAADIPVPTNVSPPQIAGWIQVGGQFTAYHGQWTNSPSSYADQWLRCSASGADCSPIPGATGSSYVATDADVGSMIRVQESASNSGGPSSPAVSPALGPISAALGPSYPPPTGPSSSSFPGDASPAPTGSPSGYPTMGGSQPQPCNLCVSTKRPVALFVPSKVASHHVFTMGLAGVRPFTVTIAISAGGHRLWRYTQRLKAGSRMIRINLPRADTGAGQTAVITAQFTLGARRITLRRTIRFA